MSLTNDQLTDKYTALAATVLNLQAKIATFQADLQAATLTLEAAFNDLTCSVQNLNTNVTQFFGSSYPLSAQYAQCTGTVPGTVFVAPGQVILVYANGGILPPTSYTLAPDNVTITTTSSVSSGLVYALCLV